MPRRNLLTSILYVSLHLKRRVLTLPNSLRGYDNLSIWRRKFMARKYSEAASKDVKRVMHERKKGTLKSGSSGAKIKSRKQAIAIGLSEARRAGKKAPKRKAAA
jgi:Family of unknown function (DUF6496)